MWTEAQWRRELEKSIDTIRRLDAEVGSLRMKVADEYNGTVRLAARVARLEEALRDIIDDGHAAYCETMQPYRQTEQVPDGCSCAVAVARHGLEIPADAVPDQK